MKYLCLFLTFVLFKPAQAVQFSKEDGRVILSTETCQEADSLARSLQLWTANTGARKTCKPQSIQSGQCKTDVTSCVPDHVVKYQDALSAEAGPNCWNLSLVMAGILPSLRYSPPEEMSFYMAPPLCRQLKNNEPRQAGDIGAIRSARFDSSLSEVHGFVYISEKLAYSKNGMAKQTPYGLHSLQSVLSLYDVEDKAACRMNELNTQACATGVSYFRCDSMQSWLEKNPQVPTQLKEKLNALNSFEECYQDYTFSGRVMGPKSIKTLTDTSAAILEYIKSEDAAKQMSAMKAEEKDFILASIYLKLTAIADGLNGTSQLPDPLSLTKGFASAASDLVYGK